MQIRIPEEKDKETAGPYPKSREGLKDTMRLKYMGNVVLLRKDVKRVLIDKLATRLLEEYKEAMKKGTFVVMQA